VTDQPLLLECVGLNAWYGAAQTVFDVNLQIACGEVVALTGNNGAGKSSTLKALMGLMPRRTGRIVFAGKDISTCEPYQAARLGMGFVPEDRRIFTDLTVLENLKVGLQAPRALPNGQTAAHWDLAQIFDLFPNLRDMQHRLGAQMSGGEQQMLTIARTLMGNPLLLLLDEPSEGVAPLIVEHMARAILNMKKRGIGVLLSEQNLAFANHVCDRQYKLIKGQLS
jgi:branched-chain amino acid transport system ATP-binding protein